MTKTSLTRLRLLALTSAGVGALMTAAPAFAQDGAVEQLVVTAPKYVPTGETTASKSQTPLVEVPQSVTVISRDQIDLLDWSTLGQVVRYTAGVTGENYGPDQRVDWLTVRGFNPVQYIDGLQAARGSISNVGLDLYGAESVEILKGPSSVLYGSSPPGGIINVTSRRPSDDFGGEVELQAGNHDRKQVNADVTGALSDSVSARLTGLYRTQGSQISGVDADRTYIAPAVTFRPTDATRITLLSYYQDDDVKGDSRGFLPPSGTYSSNPLGHTSSSTNLGEKTYNRFTREHEAIGYDAEHKLRNGLTLQQNLKVTHLESDDRGLFASGLAADNHTVSRYSFSFAENIDQVAVDTRVKYQGDTGALHHDLVAGLDFRHYDYVGSSAFAFGVPNTDLFAPVQGLNITAPPLSVFSDQVQKQTGLYVQDQIKLDKWIATLSVRHDWVKTNDRTAANADTDDKEFSYRAGLSYVFDSGFVPYVSYAKSFEPVVVAIYGGGPSKPTTGEQYEAGVKYDARGLPPGVKLFATLAAYQLTQQNVATPDAAPGHAGFSIQTGEVEVKGVEAEVVGRIDERISFNASYTYTDSEVTKSNGPDLGGRLPVTPKHKLSGLVDYTFQDGPLAGLGASLGGRYTSKTVGNLLGTYEPVLYKGAAVTLWDASAHYNVNDWRLAVTASNLFDKEYVARCSAAANCFYGSRRSVTASISRSF
ncbi:TonB-dependent ferrichrome receptor FiuA [soil metagenome]